MDVIYPNIETGEYPKQTKEIPGEKSRAKEFAARILKRATSVLPKK